MAKMKKMAFKGLKRGNLAGWGARNPKKRSKPYRANIKNLNPKLLIYLTIFAILIALLIYFGPRILGFAIIQQQTSQITLTTGTYDRTTAWNSTGLVSWWKFDEGSGNTTADSAGNNNGNLSNATAANCGTNGACPSWTDVAYSGKALKFDGLGDFVNVSDSITLNITNAITIEAWINGNDLSSTTTILWKELASYANGGTYGFGVDGGKPYFQYNPGSSNFQTWETTNSISANTWYHVAVTFTFGTGNSLKMYVDGREWSGSWISGNGNVATWSGTEDVWIGMRKATGYPQRFNGTIDEVKIWNRSLSSAEIWHEYKGRSGVYQNWTTRTEPYACDAWTAALWHFDDSAADVCGSHGGTITMTGTHDNYTQGKFGKGWQGDGAGDYVSAPDSSAWYFGTGDFTIDFWVKFNRIPNFEEAFASQYKDGADYYYFFTEDGGGGTTLLHMLFTSGSAEKGNYQGTSGYTFSTGVWYHIVFERNGATGSAFINGASYSLTEWVAFGTNDIGDIAGPLYVGARDSTHYYFNGTLDEFRVSNKSRSLDELREFYRQGTYRKQWDSGGSGQEWQTISWNVSRYSKFGQELTKDDSTVLLMHFNNDSSVGENYNNSNGSVIYDYSNGHNNGTLYTGASGQSIYSSTGGKFNGAFTFDGKDDYVDAGSASSLDNLGTGLTIAVWIKSKTNEGSRFFVAKRSASNARGYDLVLSGGAMIFEIVTTSYTAISTTNIGTDTWEFWTVTYDGSNVKLYKNGKLETSASKTGNINPCSCPLFIGKDEYSSAAYNGTIDEVAIYNRSLADWEIQDHFERGEEVRKVWMQTRSSADNITWTDWTGNKEMPQPNEQITNTTAGQNGTLLQLSFDDHQCYDEETEILTDGGWKLFSELNKNEKVLTLNQETGKEEWQTPTAYQQYGHDGEMYKIMLEDGSSLLVSPEHKVYVGIKEASLNPSSFSTINLPSKSSGLDFSLSKEENALIKDSGLLCGITSNITENNLSLGTISELAKSESLVTNILFSDVDRADTLPFVVPLGGDLTSVSLDLRNSPNLICTFSSNRNLSLWDDDIVFTSCQTSGISQSRFNSIWSQRRICFKNFFSSSSCLEHLQNQVNHDSCSLESGLSMADFGVNNNPIINFNSHEIKNQKEYLNLSEFQLMKVTDVYKQINNGREIYFLDSENKPVRVKSITKEAYSGKIYDVDVLNDIVLVRRMGKNEGEIESQINQPLQTYQNQAPDENENSDLISNLDNQNININNAQLSSENGFEKGIQKGIQVTKIECLAGDEDCMLSDGILPKESLKGQNLGSSGSRYSSLSSSSSLSAAAAFGGIWSGNSNTQTIGMRGYKGYDNELPYSQSQGNDGYTKLLLHMDGTDASTTFTDSETTQKTVTANGNAQIDTAQSKFGGASGLFDGTGDYLSLADSADWNFGDNSFTVDLWFRFNNLPAAGTGIYLFIQYEDGNHYQFLHLNYDGAIFLYRCRIWNINPVANFDRDPGVLSTGVWYHVALVRTGNTFKIFQDGIQVGADYSNYLANADNSAVLEVGGSAVVGGGYLNGWLDEFRVSKGIARWTSNFNVPSGYYIGIVSPSKFLSAVNISRGGELKYPTGASTDADTVLLCRFDNSYACDTGQNGTMSVDGYTKLLLHMDGADAGTTFADSATGKSVTANGNAQIDTAQSKFGGASGLFDGTGDYLSTADSADWNFGTGDFTIDAWIRKATLGANDEYVITQYYDADHRWAFGFTEANNNKLYFYDIVLGIYFTSDPLGLTANTWHHIALVRSGTTFSFYFNGVNKGNTIKAGALDDVVAALEVGRYAYPGAYFNGWLDELRVSKGIARWTSAFTVPTAQYPFEFETGKYGQGAKFNANATYITLKDSDDWDFGAGDFTIDTWVKLSVVSYDHSIVSQYQDGGELWILFLADTNIWYFQVRTASNTIVSVSGSDTSIATNTWYHLALVRNGNTWTIYRDGVSKGSTTDSDAVPDFPASLYVGCKDPTAAQYHFNGTLDEVRITKGRARTSNDIYQDYLGNLNKTAGTIAFWMKPEGWAGNDNNSYTFFETADADNAAFMRIGKDTNNSLFFNMNNGTDSYTKLLLHMDGGNGSQTFTDSETIPKTVITNGQAHTDTQYSKFGGASARFDGSGDYLNLSDSADFAFGSGDFTIDFWIRYNTVADVILFDKRQTAGQRAWQIYTYDAGHRIYFVWSTDGTDLPETYWTFNPSANTWYHIAMVRSGNNLMCFIDGTQAGSPYDFTGVTIYAGTSPLYIGSSYVPNVFLNGWLDELRVSKGIARWTGNFNVPTMSYPITSTILFAITNWTANNWTHVAATWNNATMKLYINGSLASSTASPMALSSVNLSSSMYIGSNALGKEQCNCSIDDFAIYNYPKTSPKAMGYTTNTGETVASAAGRYIEARAIFATKDIEKTVTLGTIIITAEDLILWVTPDYSGSTTITGNTMTLNVLFTDTTTHLYDVECNITSSGGTNMWGIYFPQSYVLENTTFNITATIDMSSWTEGNYTTTCRARDI